MCVTQAGRQAGKQPLGTPHTQGRDLSGGKRGGGVNDEYALDYTENISSDSGDVSARCVHSAQ